MERVVSACAFAPVAVAAEHLTVVGCRDAALGPRRDVVCLHFLELEVLAAVRADALLTFVGLALLLLVEGAEREVAQVAREDIAVDARLLHYLVVLHECSDLFLQRLRVVDLLVIAVVEQSR